MAKYSLNLEKIHYRSGGISKLYQWQFLFRKGDYVIAEADESDGSFLKFNSYVTVVMNIEDDHLDHYGSIENIRKAFVEFIEKFMMLQEQLFFAMTAKAFEP